MNAPSTIDRIQEGLSPEQRAAVLHGEGPLLIVAGAGTGKTTVLTRRIAHLIATKAARPEEILALTFTEKAAFEMRERVDALIPYGYAESFISTFHAFGDRMLRENCFAASLPADFRVLTRAEEIVFLRERLFDLPLDRLRPLGDPGRHLGPLVEFTSRAKDEDISPEDIERLAQATLAQAEENPSLGTPHQQEDLGKRERALDLIEAAAFFRAQQHHLLSKGLVDFGDQLQLLLALLRKRHDVREALQSRFKYVLVDEFQDTNHAQLELVRLIAQGETPNVTVVGDDDQAIYRWRGAAPANLISFLESYKSATRIVLRRNYRSTQVILDAAHRLITYNNPWRLEAIAGISKRLESDLHTGPPVDHRHFETVSQEADAVADAIERAYRDDGVPLSEIAILVRNNHDADPFLRSLNMRQIPHRFSGGAGLFERTEVRFLIAFLRVLAAPDDSVSTYFLASSEVYTTDAMELGRLTRFATRKSKPLLEVLRELTGDQNNDTKAELVSIGGSTRESLKRLMADLSRAASSMAERRTGEVLYEFLKTSGALERWVRKSTPENERKVANVARFFEIVRGFGAIAVHDRVPSFVERFDLLRDAGEDPPASEQEGEEAVNVMTVHKAKGLEFRIVFIVSCVEQKFPLRRRADPLPLPESLLKGELSGGDAHFMEERRLFYVAMTRAKTSLTLTSAADYGSSASRKISRFVIEALDLPSPKQRPKPPSPLEAIEASAPVADPAPAASASEEPPLDPATLPGLRLSFRQINDYLTCPLQYRFIHRQRIPLLMHHRVIYGSAVHSAVQALFKARQEERPFSADDLVAAFRGAWVSEGFLSRAHEDRRLSEGEKALRDFYEAESKDPLYPSAVEEEFSFQVGRHRVIGRYDLISTTPQGDITILDFKTGDVSSAEEAVAKAVASRQLAVYALAHVRTQGILPKRVELRFLESRLAGGYEPTLAQCSETERMIATTADRISRGLFDATPSHHACRPCPFRDICPATARSSG